VIPTEQQNGASFLQMAAQPFEESPSKLCMTATDTICKDIACYKEEIDFMGFA
jgi:hypothetical protein